ncbi:MAG: tRNA lysidine(34) synthetase TilS [Candidatus Cloacimonas sp.]
MEIAKALKYLEKYIKDNELIHNGDKLLLGCSGGADSNAMLYLFSRLRVSYNLTLLVVHINHQIRGAESNADEESVKQLCLKLNIPVIIHKITIPPKGNLENQARKQRFAAFEKVLECYNFDKILLAHQKDDQAETVLLNLLRGSGISGMAGIKPISGKIVHPMLCFSRKELEEILVQAEISWRTDSSNLDNKFRRNLLRNDIIPKLKQEFNPALSSHLSFISELFDNTDKYFVQRSKAHLKKICLDAQPTKIVLSSPQVLKLPKIERYYLLRKAFETVCGSNNDFFAAHYLAIENILTTPGSKCLYLPHNVTVIKQYEEFEIQWGENKLKAEKEPMLIESDRIMAVYGNYRFNFKYLRVLPKDLKCEDGQVQIIIDADKIRFPFMIRYRKPGDRFMPFGMTQLKKLKEFFIDEKVPKYERDSIPLFDDGEKIFWVACHRLDNRVRCDENTSRYLQIVANNISEKTRRAIHKKEKRQ